MTDTPTNPKAILEIAPGVTYVVTQEDAIFRNERQVLIPHEGEDILSELHLVMNLLGEATLRGDAALIAGLTAPPEGADTPQAGEALPLLPVLGVDEKSTDSHPTDMTWEGFEVKGYRLEGGEVRAEIEHRKHRVSMTMDYDRARDILDWAESTVADAYEVLCAMAFMEWAERNSVKPVPDWPTGLHVRRRDEWNVWGVVAAHPHAPTKRFLLLANSEVISLIAANSEKLSTFEPIPHK